MAVRRDAGGNYNSIGRVTTGYDSMEPIDMKSCTDGDLYRLEYGSNGFRKSDNATLGEHKKDWGADRSVK